MSVPGQLSVAVGVVYDTVAVQDGPLPDATMLPGQDMLGAWLSTTVTVNEQVDERPDTSIARQVTAVLPTGKLEPLAGPPMRTIVIAPVQLSVAIGVEYVTVAAQVLAAVFTAGTVGQEITGGSLSFTVTRKVQVLVKPA